MPKPNFTDSKKQKERIIRVDHAGEYGAAAIYRGQIDYIKGIEDKREITHMLEQEQEHLDYFTHMLGLEQVRPTILLGIWQKMGYFAGAVSAKMGTRAAMLLTESVEEVIEKHYREQIVYLEETNKEPDMLAKLKKFQADEIEHKHTAREYNKGGLPSMIARKAINMVCYGAIYLSKRV